jgi:hypothetical protein
MNVNDSPTDPTIAEPQTKRLAAVGAVAADDVTFEEHDADLITIGRIEHLPPEVGWLLMWVGALGFILPGVVGLPFIIAGAAVVVPGGRKMLADWAGRNPPKIVRASMKQISRMLDDLDRRYPVLPKNTT